MHVFHRSVIQVLNTGYGIMPVDIYSITSTYLLFAHSYRLQSHRETFKRFQLKNHRKKERDKYIIFHYEMHCIEQLINDLAMPMTIQSRYDSKLVAGSGSNSNCERKLRIEYNLQCTALCAVNSLLIVFQR